MHWSTSLPVASALGFAFAFALAVGAPLRAQTVPSLDTEDATLGADPAGPGRLHASFGADLRNGDFARGNYDDDAANLKRLPLHLQLGLGIDLHRQQADGPADWWLVLRSSNGLHRPASDETTAPRGWYESNNLVALVAEPMSGLRVAAVYTVKASPNDVSPTAHEASLSIAYANRQTMTGRLRPTFVATVRPKGGHGAYTQLGIEPEWSPGGGGDAAPKLGLPVRLGVGWNDFYAAGSGRRMFGAVGLALQKATKLGGSTWTLRGELRALVRDTPLSRLSDKGETGRTVPLGTVGLAVTY